MNTYPYTEAVLHRAVLVVACMNYGAQRWAEERSAPRREVCVFAIEWRQLLEELESALRLSRLRNYSNYNPLTISFRFASGWEKVTCTSNSLPHSCSCSCYQRICKTSSLYCKPHAPTLKYNGTTVNENANESQRLTHLFPRTNLPFLSSHRPSSASS
jgi:hypothetical protein